MIGQIYTCDKTVCFDWLFQGKLKGSNFGGKNEGKYF